MDLQPGDETEFLVVVAHYEPVRRAASKKTPSGRTVGRRRGLSVAALDGRRRALVGRAAPPARQALDTFVVKNPRVYPTKRTLTSNETWS